MRLSTSIPIKYSMTTGKLLGIVADKDKTTLLIIISSPVDKRTLRIELPRNVIDDKGQGNKSSVIPNVVIPSSKSFVQIF